MIWTISEALATPDLIQARDEIEDVGVITRLGFTRRLLGAVAGEMKRLKVEVERLRKELLGEWRRKIAIEHCERRIKKLEAVKAAGGKHG